MANFQNITIKEIQKETADAVSIVFDIPENKKSEFQFQSGQYITLQKEIQGEAVRRAYSICSTPNSGELRVAVKAVQDGTFSVYATSKLKVGDVIEVAPPEGRFLLDPKPNQNYIAFAAGSGITPIISMAKTVLETEPTSSFTLVYGNRSKADTIFYDQLIELREQYPQFHLEFVFSRERNPEAKFGRIDAGMTNLFIKNKYKETEFDSAYLCGPEEMIHAVSDTLKINGFGDNQIHFELFTVSVDEEAEASIQDGKTEITVVLDDEETTFTMDQKHDILAASLREDLDPPYSCQGGVCSSCIAKVTEGKAVMTKNTILTDAEVKEGFVLTCQAHPTTAKIVVDFDDV